MTKNLKTCPLTKQQLTEIYVKSAYNISEMPTKIFEEYGIFLSRQQINRFLVECNIKLSEKEKCMSFCPYSKEILIEKIKEAGMNIENFVRIENSNKITAHRVLNWLKYYDVNKNIVMNRTLGGKCPIEKESFLELIYSVGFNMYEMDRKFLSLYGKKCRTKRFCKEFGLDFLEIRKQYLNAISSIEPIILLTTLEKYKYDIMKVTEVMSLPHWSIIENVFNNNKINSFKVLYNNRKLFGSIILSKIAKKLNVPECHVKEYRILSDLPLTDTIWASSAELEILNYIRALNINACKKRIIFEGSSFEIDIFIPEKMIGFEFNGAYWHSDLFRNKKYHSVKNLKAKQAGIILYHIFEHEWNSKQEIIKSFIKHKLGCTANKYYARNLVLAEDIAITEEKIFLNNNHIQGYVRSHKQLGLRDEFGKLIMVLTLGKPRFNKKYQWEILRVSTKLDTHVIGGTSKLIKNFILSNNPESILSYVDLGQGSGDSYKNSGLSFLGYTEPGYFYASGDEVKSRYQCQKHKLITLSKYDPALTEKEIMRLHGFFRIYDSGNAKFEYKSNTQ